MRFIDRSWLQDFRLVDRFVSERSLPSFDAKAADGYLSLKARNARAGATAAHAAARWRQKF
jgi:hypothetical protein